LLLEVYSSAMSHHPQPPAHAAPVPIFSTRPARRSASSTRKVRLRGTWSIVKVMLFLGTIAAAPNIWIWTASGAGVGLQTPEEWQQMYDACLQGAAYVAGQRNLTVEFPALFCSCVSDDLKRTPNADRNAQFPAIRDRCLQRYMR
jgi:hypothetical protein